MIDPYLELINATLSYIQNQQRAAILTAARWLSESLINKGLLYITGTGHSHMIAEEVFYRAGGLAAVYPILEPALMLHEGAIKSTAMERLEGLASILMQDLPINQDDVLVVASNSGRNAFPIEIVLEAKARGCKTIAITSMHHSQQVSSRHSSGKRLFEVADLVIDNGVGYGDATLELSGLAAKMGPVSSIAGIFIINSMVLEATSLCLQKGHVPDVFISANTQASKQNFDLDIWKQRIKRL
jgi:uncharacterized phosphosugar-binding protein